MMTSTATSTKRWGIYSTRTGRVFWSTTSREAARSYKRKSPKTYRIFDKQTGNFVR